MQGDIGDLYVRTTQTVSGRAGPLSRRSCPDTLTHYFCIAGHDCCLETFPENPRARKQPASPEINAETTNKETRTTNRYAPRPPALRHTPHQLFFQHLLLLACRTPSYSYRLANLPQPLSISSPSSARCAIFQQRLKIT